jgi:hypothetical protein
MTNIVERLRSGVYGVDRIPLCAEAADEIERLRAALAAQPAPVRCVDGGWLGIADMPANYPTRAAQPAEPVAWRFKLDGDLQWQHTDKWQILPCFGKVEPLYTHPAAPVPVPPGWMPIETAPKDGRLILLITGRGVCVIGKRNKHLDIWVERDGRETPRTITHWMPLPPPPQENDK